MDFGNLCFNKYSRKPEVANIFGTFLVQNGPQCIEGIKHQRQRTKQKGVTSFNVTPYKLPVRYKETLVSNRSYMYLLHFSVKSKQNRIFLRTIFFVCEIGIFLKTLQPIVHRELRTKWKSLFDLDLCSNS